MSTVEIIGAGLAGCEAALQCARRGVPVRLFEMRPGKMTEAHETGDVAELVCSNSLKSDEQTNAHGLLKAELRVLGSVLLDCAERARVPGGKALVVDRLRFSQEVQAGLTQAGVTIERAEVSSLPPVAGASKAAGITVIATGPLTSQAMADALQTAFGVDRLFFHDAIAPIVSAESLDMTRVFEGSRYGADGPADNAECKVQNADCKIEEAATSRQAAGSAYLNCPMTEEDYDRFMAALLEAELHPVHEFEGPQFFEGCLPVEEIARRGRLALAFGPMKPVGLVDPHTGKRPFAVVQLRRENSEGTMHNLVGFQTRLRQGEQERVFRMIPGLEKVTFLRFGSIHRNTYLDSPRVLLPTLQSRIRPDLLIAGQLTGVEGYVESVGAGLVAGINAARLAKGDESVELPRETMLGSLLRYVAGGAENLGQSQAARTRPQSGTAPVFRFQPMNANFGLPPPLGKRLRGRDKRSALAERALEAAREFDLTLARNGG